MYTAFHGSLDNQKSIGTNNLIKEGAKIVISPKDIITNYNFLHKVSEFENRIVLEDNEDNIQEIDEEYKDVYKVISKDATDLNYIAKQANMNLSEVISKLTMLELEGKVKKIVGNKYKRI